MGTKIKVQMVSGSDMLGVGGDFQSVVAPIFFFLVGDIEGAKYVSEEIKLQKFAENG